MLADIPVRQGGVAGSIGQLGQRIGTAVGTAVALALFYSTVYRERGNDNDLVVFHDAYAIGMISVGVFLGLALIAGVVDLASRRRSGEPLTPAGGVQTPQSPRMCSRSQREPSTTAVSHGSVAPSRARPDRKRIGEGKN